MRANCESVQTGGVQPWSAGELMPWTVVVRCWYSRGHLTVGVCQPLNGETGEVGSEYTFYPDAEGKLGRSFTLAHESAEAWVAAHRAGGFRAMQVAERMAAMRQILSYGRCHGAYQEQVNPPYVAPFSL